MVRLTAAVIVVFGVWAGIAQAVIIEMVPVRNPGNANGPFGKGGVDYVYFISKYEVTNAQYAGFLNEVDPEGTNPYDLYSNGMGDSTSGISFDAGNPSGSKYAIHSDHGNWPVTAVS